MKRKVENKYPFLDRNDRMYRKHRRKMREDYGQHILYL